DDPTWRNGETCGQDDQRQQPDHLAPCESVGRAHPGNQPILDAVYQVSQRSPRRGGGRNFSTGASSSTHTYCDVPSLAFRVMRRATSREPPAKNSIQAPAAPNQSARNTADSAPTAKRSTKRPPRIPTRNPTAVRTIPERST